MIQPYKREGAPFPVSRSIIVSDFSDTSERDAELHLSLLNEFLQEELEFYSSHSSRKGWRGHIDRARYRIIGAWQVLTGKARAKLLS